MQHKHDRRCLLVLAALAATLAAGAAPGGCAERLASFRVHRLLGVRVVSVEQDGFLASVRCEIENTNPIAVELHAVRFRAWLGDRPIGSGRIPGPLLAPARGRFVLEAPLRVRFSDLPADLPARLAGGRLPLRTEVTLEAQTRLGRHRMRLAAEDEIPLPEVLDAAVTGPFRARTVRLTGLRPSGLGLVDVRFRLELAARNVFPFPVVIRGGRLSLAVNGRHFGYGELAAAIRLPPLGATRAEVDVTARHGDVARSLVASLAEEPRFRIRGELWLEPIGGLSRLPVDIEADSSVLATSP